MVTVIALLVLGFVGPQLSERQLVALVLVLTLLTGLRIGLAV